MYENGKIYCIKSDSNPNLIYIGSTTQPLSERLTQHKSNYKKWKNNTKNYITSFEVVKFEDCYIQLIENYPCDSKKELCRREGEHIRNMTTVNKEIPGRTIKEWKQDNKELIAQKIKEYNEKHKEQKKQWYETNKEQIAQKKKQHYETNRDKIAQKKKEKIYCEFCDISICKDKMTRHEKSLKHIKNFIYF